MPRMSKSDERLRQALCGHYGLGVRSFVALSEGHELIRQNWIKLSPPTKIGSWLQYIGYVIILDTNMNTELLLTAVDKALWLE
jgi:hypothetical protein